MEPPIDDTENAEGSDKIPEQTEETVTPDDDDDDSDVEEAAASSPVPRRSTRKRRAPRWMKDFVSKQAQTSSTPDWMSRAEFLRSMALTGEFQKMGSEVSGAIVKIISDGKT